MSKRRTFLGGIDDEEEEDNERYADESRSGGSQSRREHEGLELDESAQDLRQDLNEALRGEVVLSTSTLDRVAEILFRHSNVLQTIVSDRTLSVIYEEYSVHELEQVLLRVEGIEYGGSFAARTPDETGVVYRIEQ